MSKASIIPAKNTTEFPHVYRVAAYCRVSTQQEAQYHSLEAQREYYEKYINSKINWALVDIYSDQASGRHNLRMKEFQRMMSDCRAGKIDFIIIKSISRLGRNTLQFLQACNELNALGVDAYFEIEKLHISNPSAMQLLTIYAAVYQNESEAKSHSIKWGFHVRFRNGDSKFYNRPCYGYKQSADDTLEIVPEKAAVVKLIYDLKSQGASLRTIAKHLMGMNIPAPRGGNLWSIETIRKILCNEKYHGDVLLQKTYVADYFTGKQAINRGEYERFLIENHHDPIVEKPS